MAKTVELNIRGKVKWHKHERPNQWNKYSVVVYPIPEDLEKIRDLQAEGLKNVVKKDEDGYYTTFSCPTSKAFGNQVRAFNPPMVFEADGRTPLKVAVGNGSTGIVTLDVYQHKVPAGAPGQMAKAARWRSTTILDLVPYEPLRDNSAFEESKRPQQEGVTEPFF